LKAPEGAAHPSNQNDDESIGIYSVIYMVNMVTMVKDAIGS
jgi:hypothetical protein